MPIINTSFFQTGTNTSDATATASQILAPYTAYVASGKVTGAMPDNGAVSKALEIGSQYQIPQGYHNGQGVVSCPERDLRTIQIDSSSYISSKRLSFSFSSGVSFDLNKVLYFALDADALLQIGTTGNTYILSLAGTNTTYLDSTMEQIDYVESYWIDEATTTYVRVGSLNWTSSKISDIISISGNAVTVDVSTINTGGASFDPERSYRLRVRYVL